MRQRVKVIAAVTMLLGMAVGTASATLSAVGDAGSWYVAGGGADTLAGLGFGMTRVTDDPVANGGPGHDVSSLDSGKVQFEPLTVYPPPPATNWYWFEGSEAESLYTTYPAFGPSITLTFSEGVRAFDLYVDAYRADNDFVTVTAMSGLEEKGLSQPAPYQIDGAAYFGFYSDSHDITSITIAIDPLSGGGVIVIGDLRLAGARSGDPNVVPAPGAALLVALGIGVVGWVRKRIA